MGGVSGGAMPDRVSTANPRRPACEHEAETIRRRELSGISVDSRPARSTGGDQGIRGPEHSYEDAITPVEEAVRRWGSRIAILGGIDNDFLTRRPAAEVAARARALVAAAPVGYALGSGNSLTAAMPAANVDALTAAVLGRN
jgi:hypothetical protein